MNKKIGITCDNYKANKFRKGLLKDGFVLEYDGESGIKNVHLFRIECSHEEFQEMTNRIGKTVKRLELEFKRSN
jgi:hypothetical protein